jgi:hypothetical protein
VLVAAFSGGTQNCPQFLLALGADQPEHFLQALPQQAVAEEVEAGFSPAHAHDARFLRMECKTSSLRPLADLSQRLVAEPASRVSTTIELS